MSATETIRLQFQPNLAALARWIAGLSGWRRAALGFTLGAAAVLAFAPFGIWPLLFLILPCFIWLMDGIAGSAPGAKPRWRQAALAGWWLGFGFFAAGLYWMGFAFFVEADKTAWMVPLAVLAFPAAMALFFAAAGAAAIALWRPGAARIFAFTAAFFAADWLRGHIFTGFPWNLWGYAIPAGNPLAQTASIFGIYSLTLLVLLVFASPAALAGPLPRGGARSWLLPALCLALLAAGWSWGAIRLAGATSDVHPDVQLRIVQPNVPQSEKWKPESRQWIFDRLMELSRKPREGEGAAARTTHLIWPESSTPFLFLLNDFMPYADARQALAGLTSPGTTLILGAERVEGTRRDDGRYDVDRVFNSLFIVGGEAAVTSIYDKVHLVPFGEYLPFEATLSALGIKQLTHRDGGFAAGHAHPLLAAPGAPPFIPLICYEVIFPEGISAEGGRPGWLLNLTNDSWFGNSTGPHQHFQQARMRAVEQGLPLIRAANTGISAVVDGYGRPLATLPLGVIGTIDHALPVAIGPTLYSRWGENWLLLVAFLIFLLYRFVIQVE